MNTDESVPTTNPVTPNLTPEVASPNPFESQTPIVPVASASTAPSIAPLQPTPASFVPPVTAVVTSGKSYVGTWLLAWLLPGIELIYLGYIVRGIIKFITIGGFGIWTIISLVRLFMGKTVGKDGRPLVGHDKYLKLSLVITIVVTVLQIGISTTLYATGFYANNFKSLNTSGTNLTTTISNSSSISTVVANARTVQSIAESFNANGTTSRSQYPTKISDFSNVPGLSLPSGITVTSTDPSETNGKTTIGYQYANGVSPASGGRITFWDYSTNTLTSNPLYVGDATVRSVFIVPAS